MVSSVSVKLKPSIGDAVMEKSDKEKKFDKVQNLLLSLMANGWFGKVTISFESGTAVNIKKEENIKT
jgi:hypothetical protein